MSGDERLVGTLIKPKGKSPWPVVVFCHYSGTQTRDADNYRRRAERFARAGIAAFIYDRRGRGESSGDPHRFIPFQQLAADAIQAAEALRRRPDVLPEQIGVSGHSQGGWVAPLAVTLSDAFKFVIVSSAAGITPDEQELFVMENAVGADVTADELERLKELSPSDRVRSFDPDDAERNLAFFLFDPLPVWGTVTVPVFAIWGSADRLVPAEKSRHLIETALNEAGNHQATMMVLADATHDLEGTRAEDSMIEWLLRQLAAVPQPLPRPG